MSETPGVPSANELDELLRIVKSDPSSPAFVDLGEAFLSLGRPRDALEVGARGLKADPRNIEGRMMVSRAFCKLHQWKQAQAELLKVVKSDRQNSEGFRLLGEVLMRRADYERALPVLQHAQNLDPANPGILALLKRARAGQALDPPEPIPTPRRPGRSSAPPPPRSRNAARIAELDDAPTRVADDPLSAERGDPTEQVDMGFGDDGPTNVASAELIDPDTARVPSPPPRRPSPPSGPISARLPLQGGETSKHAPAPPRNKGPTRPLPGATKLPGPGKPSAMPRVFTGEKPKDAAQVALRQSAAMGENYLNNLLVSGLLDVPNVRAPDGDVEIRGGKRWGRSTTRAFIVLFVMLFLGLGGGGAWYYTTMKQRDADVAEHQETARALLDSGRYADLTDAEAEMKKALDRQNDNLDSMALYARAGGVKALLYGTPTKTVDIALGTVTRKIDEDHAAWRDTLIGKAASTLALLAEMEEPVDRLTEIRAEIDAWLETHPDDVWVRWLQARAQAAAGEREQAKAALRAISEDLVVATIDLADIALDEGDHEQALELYGEALERSEKHPLAIVGRALARTVASSNMDENMADLNVALDRELGPRLDAYKQLAFAFSSYVLEDYVELGKKLDAAWAHGVADPRFRARIALGRIAQGKLKEAADVRSTISWFSAKKPETHPLVAVVDAELLLAYGRADAALDALGKGEGLRAATVRGRALFDLGKYDEAAEELKKVLDADELDLEAGVWYHAARLAGAARGEARTEADDELVKLARQAQSKIARHARGVALMAAGRTADARRSLELALEDITDEQPNPIAYRTHVALAQLDLAAGEIEDAAEHVDAAVEQNLGFVPAHAAKGRILLDLEKFAEAAEELQHVVDVPEIASWKDELAYATAIQGTGTKDEGFLESAKQALRRAKDKGAEGEDFDALVLALDPEWAEELGIEEDD